MRRAAPARPAVARPLGRTVGLALLAALLFAGGRARPDVIAQDEATVTYHAGWNIVAAPAGSLVGKVNGPIYALGPGADSYDAISPEQLLGGRAAWVYFAQDTTITLGRSAAEYSRTIVQANQYVLAGDPSGSEAVAVNGPGVTAFTYDPALGYTQTAELRPGQGAFLIADQDGAITLGKAPAGQSTDALASVQASLTANPTDRGAYDQLAKITADLVSSRQYAQVQTAIDDVSAAADDGLRRQGAGVPPLDAVQRDSAVSVREAVATAKSDAALGNSAGADTAIDQARTAAQQALNDGLSVGRSAAAIAALSYAQAAPAGLTRARGLARAGVPLAGLGRPLPDLFFATLTALATGAPLPAGPTPTAAPAIRFSGNVTVNGLPAANSTVVASVNGVSCGTGPIAADGSYSLDIQGTAACTMPGATVQFSVGGEPATPTGTIPTAPGPVRLDLAITTQHGLGGQPGQPTPAPAQPSNAAEPFGSCASGQISLQFLTESEAPPGLINDVFRYQVLGLPPGAAYAVYAAAVPSSGQTDQFVATARQAGGGVVDTQGQASGTLTLTTVHPANARPIATLYALELVAGNACFDGFASVPQQSSGPINPPTPTSSTPCHPSTATACS